MQSFARALILNEVLLAELLMFAQCTNGVWRMLGLKGFLRPDRNKAHALDEKHTGNEKMQFPGVRGNQVSLRRPTHRSRAAVLAMGVCENAEAKT